MSKESKPRDRWSQVFTAAADRAGFCKGCGYYYAANGTHRTDCTVEVGQVTNQEAHHG